MARYSPQHKEATRQRILATAGRRLKTDGIDGSGVSTLMADAGLTNGAFYSHFTSKEELVAAALGEQMHQQRDALREVADHPGALREFLTAYLSAAHRDTPAQGCPSGALLDEVARSSVAVRQAYTDALLEVIDALRQAQTTESNNQTDDQAGAQEGDQGSRVAALGLFASLVGTLQLSRAITDPDLSQALLDHTLTAALETLPPAGDGVLSKGTTP